MGILPDTNVVINFLAGKNPDKKFLEGLLLQKNRLFISPIVVGEYLAKCPPKEEVFLREFIELGQVIPVDLDISFVSGKYRQLFVNKTKEIYLLDCFIAATCKVHNLTLITNDRKDYPMKDIKILKPA